jgi:hypothetical protein
VSFLLPVAALAEGPATADSQASSKSTAATVSSARPGKHRAHKSAAVRGRKGPAPSLAEVAAFTAPLTADPGEMHAAAVPGPFALPKDLDSGAVKLSIEECNELTGDASLIDAQYFLNGEPLVTHRERFVFTSTVFNGSTQAGHNVLRIRVKAKVAPRFLFVRRTPVTVIAEKSFVFRAPESGEVNVRLTFSDAGSGMSNPASRVQVRVQASSFEGESDRSTGAAPHSAILASSGDPRFQEGVIP